MYRKHPKLFNRPKKAKRSDPNNPYEKEIQIRLVDWMEDNGILYFMVPNEGERSTGASITAKAMGLRKGVPDLVIPMPRAPWHGMYLELKRLKGGTVSVDQLWWKVALESQGYYCAITRGYNEAERAVRNYLGIK